MQKDKPNDQAALEKTGSNKKDGAKRFYLKICNGPRSNNQLEISAIYPQGLLQHVNREIVRYSTHTRWISCTILLSIVG